MKTLDLKGREPVMDAVDAFDRLFVITHRTPTLEGELPSRAVQSCPPMLEGTAAGFQVVAMKPILLDRDESARPRVGMRDSALARVAGQAERVDRLVALGLLRPNSEWHRLLREKLYWVEGDAVHLWTGHLIRPRPGHILYLTTSFNRRSAATLEDRVFERSEWYPLVLKLAAPERAEPPLWMSGDVACLLPVSPRATWRKGLLDEVPELGDQFNTFYNGYWERAGRRPDRYVRLVRNESMSGPDDASCDLAYLGPDVYDFEPLAPVASADGPTPEKTSAITCAIVRNLATYSGTWDGHVMMGRRGPLKAQIDAFCGRWAGLYGQEPAGRLTSLTRYAFAAEPGRREFLLRPWAFVRTPPGWSTVIDALQFPHVQGFRGVLSTDVHHSPPLVLRVTETGRFSVAKNARVARLLPVPRQLLRTTFTLRRLADLETRAAMAPATAPA